MITTHTHTSSRFFGGLLSLILLGIVAAHPVYAQVVTPAPVAWPTTWTPYAVKNDPIKDVKTGDPSNGGTSPQGSVNLTSGVPDGSLPSAYYASDGTHLFVRFRLESSPASYSAGAKYKDSDPWGSALWTFLLDIEGDGWRDFAILLNGSSGGRARRSTRSRSFTHD